jgi:hypothetical protein
VPQNASPIRCSPRCRTSSTRVSSTDAPHSAQLPSSPAGDGRSARTPASQCGPCIAHGTMCSSRQKTASRSPASSAARKPSPGSTATPHQLQRPDGMFGSLSLARSVAAQPAVSPVFAGNSAFRSSQGMAPCESIRGHGYLHEHMFPFRPSAAATALLELADAVLAPAQQIEAAVPLASTPCRPAHPHQRTVSRRLRRRPASAAPAQPCLTPLARKPTPGSQQPASVLTRQPDSAHDVRTSLPGS